MYDDDLNSKLCSLIFFASGNLFKKIIGFRIFLNIFFRTKNYFKAKRLKRYFHPEETSKKLSFFEKFGKKMFTLILLS